MNLVEKVKSLFTLKSRSIGTELEQYILSRNPANASDVERLTFEFQLSLSRSGLV